MKKMLQMVLFKAKCERCEKRRISSLFWHICFQNGAQMENDVYEDEEFYVDFWNRWLENSNRKNKPQNGVVQSGVLKTSVTRLE